MKLMKHIFLFILMFGCKPDPIAEKKPISKIQDSDKFKNTIVESQLYGINAGKDNTIETKGGNVFIIPTGSLLDKNGHPVNDSVVIEFAGASEIDEVILSNLTIQDSSKIYESYLSFFVNATRKGEQLTINPENPIYFEILMDKKANLYKGIRSEQGEMKWEKALEPVNYLIPVAMDLLDFYPEGFESEIEKGLPFKNHVITTKELLDSLYYSFASEIDKSGYYNWNNRVGMINLITPTLNLLAQTDTTYIEAVADSVGPSFCGINPASIKAIRSKKFEKTLVSTREFEYRLKTIFATCKNQIIELYINNLNKNIWEIDEMAANLLGNSHSQHSKFIEFASYKQTTVKLSDKKAELLAKHYKNSKEKIEDDLEKIKKEFLKDRKKVEQIAQKKKEEYRKLLESRFTYRMKKFGFEINDFGWYNAAQEIKLKDLEKFDLNVVIDNGKQYDRVYSYVINPKINSIFSILSIDKRTFDIAYFEDPILLLWKNQKFNVIGVGYLENEIAYKIQEATQKPIVNVDLSLEKSNNETFRKDLKKFIIGYKKENNILVDLEYHAFFYKEKKRREKEEAERLFIRKLRAKIFPCCNWYFPEDVDEIYDLEIE